MSENINELLVIGSGMSLAEIFKTENIDSLLAGIEEKARAFKGDPSTDKGRKAIASMGHMVARSKTFLDSRGKELTQDRKDEIKLVDNERKKIRERLDDLKEEVIKPKVDWDLAEERKKHKQISTMKRLNDLYYVNSDKSVDELQRYIDECNSIIIEGDADFIEKAAKEKEITLASLEKKLADRIQHNKDQEELAKLRAEREEREKKEAAEKAEKEQAEREEEIRLQAVETEKRESEQRAKAESERVEREKEEAAEKLADAEKRIEEEKASNEAAIKLAKKNERDLIAKEQADKEEVERIEREKAKKKAANKKHRASIISAVEDELVGMVGLTKGQAQDVIEHVLDGAIPHMNINF